MNAKFFKCILLCLLPLAQSYGATKTMIWGSPKRHNILINGSGEYQFKKVGDNSQHQRYQLYFNEKPVWGYQIIKHPSLITGVMIEGIEQDIQIKKRLNTKVARNLVAKKLQGEIVQESFEKIIYLDPLNKAHDSYLISFYTSVPAAPQFIVDSQTGEVLLQWDELKQERIGQGYGGNTLQLPYRQGEFYHSSNRSEEYNLGPFDVVIKGKKCQVKNQFVKIVNSRKYELTRESFPMTRSKEIQMNIHTFSYPCSKESGYINDDDENTAPVNYSFSPINDAMYFAALTIEMYQNTYGVRNPLGDDVPLRVYTHIKNMDNAFSVSSIKTKGVYTIHQHIGVGDGLKIMTAPVQGSIAHELSHNVTHWNSRLVYQGQSGGINESFSDMATIAMQDHLRDSHPWYWDGKDWSIGMEVTLTNKPIRYMDSPSRDHKSIEHAEDYIEGMNVHYSSGIYNKAFYLLSTKEGWTIKKAFQVMVDANTSYWTPRMNFAEAACGVIQSAKDRHYSYQDVVDVYREVGVRCPAPIN